MQCDVNVGYAAIIISKDNFKATFCVMSCLQTTPEINKNSLADRSEGMSQYFPEKHLS